MERTIVLKVSDKPLGELNTRRRVKIFQKKTLNNISVVKFKSFTPGVKKFRLQI